MSDKASRPVKICSDCNALEDEIERLRAALERIAALDSHRHPCCPTNMPKHIAREALRDD